MTLTSVFPLHAEERSLPPLIYSLTFSSWFLGTWHRCFRCFVLFACRRSASPNKAAYFSSIPCILFSISFCVWTWCFQIIGILRHRCIVLMFLLCEELTGKATVFNIYIILYNIEAVVPVKSDSNQAFNLLWKQMRIFGANKRCDSGFTTVISFK